MDDIGRAMLMAGEVLIFVFALTVALLLYYRIDTNMDNVFFAGNYSNRGDAIQTISGDTTRVVNRREVIMGIFNLLKGTRISVNSMVGESHLYTYYGDNLMMDYYLPVTRDLCINIIPAGKYRIRSITDKEIIYDQISDDESDILSYGVVNNPVNPGIGPGTDEEIIIGH